MALNESKVLLLPLHLGNLYRLNKAGYGNSRVTSLTTLASFVADIETYKDLINPALHPLCDAAKDSVRWLHLQGIIDTTIITALTTFYDTSVSATTDMSYNVRGHAQYPATFPNTGADVSYFQPSA